MTREIGLNVIRKSIVEVCEIPMYARIMRDNTGLPRVSLALCRLGRPWVGNGAGVESGPLIQESRIGGTGGQPGCIPSLMKGLAYHEET